ncbi:MAG TPA: metallophosphoesterase family protein [Polyangiaceae bacterium]|nr:metallophosphoesterase family protein [Polyangiaceae bacterium]
MKHRASAMPKIVQAREEFPMEGALRIVAVADTHGRPHPALDARLAELAPARILHAGDVGDLGVLSDLEKHAPVTAVRGNIDGPVLPDQVIVDVRSAGGVLLRILLTHIAVYGPKLRADVARTARSEDASLVVCGHSHVPFAAHEKGITVFNPGSVGPRRFSLPIVLGVIDVSETGVAVRHVDCETGLPWKP